MRARLRKDERFLVGLTSNQANFIIKLLGGLDDADPISKRTAKRCEKIILHAMFDARKLP